MGVGVCVSFSCLCFHIIKCKYLNQIKCLSELITIVFQIHSITCSCYNNIRICLCRYLQPENCSHNQMNKRRFYMLPIIRMHT